MGRAWGAWAEAEPVAGEGGHADDGMSCPGTSLRWCPAGVCACVHALQTSELLIPYLSSSPSLTVDSLLLAHMRRKSRGLGQGEADTCPGF